MSIVVVGSVALDSVQTPSGCVEEELGGSASYFSLAASLYGEVRLLAVVGDDFPARHVHCLRERGIDLSGLQVAEGRTFRWKGCYEGDLNTAITLDTQLNVFSQFHPTLPEACREPSCLFLANIDPDLQLEVLSQIGGAGLTAADTMDFWIQRKKDSLTRVFCRVDMVVINEAEAKEYADTRNVVAAARGILALGPKAVVVKRGEYGCALFTDSGYFVAPAYPLEHVQDPTGAGDTFAGGLIGYLAQAGEASPAVVRRAILHGSAVASFAVEDFGVRRLLTLSGSEVVARCRELREFTYLEGI